MKNRHLTLPLSGLLVFLTLTLITTAHAAGPFRQELGQVRPTGRATISDPPGGRILPRIMDGLDEEGRNLASGTYFFRLSGSGEEHIRKGVLVR